MDISDISKVANRKRMNADVEKLREKVSHETAKIIKLKVAQDTAYWDLKEKLKGVEREHERLQRNMVEVQMQHEAVSARHQDELRLRPETLNKLASTREICDVLEEHVGRVRTTLQRCATDRDALAAAYARAAAAVDAVRADLARRAAAAAERERALRDARAHSAEHVDQLTQCAAAATRHAEETKAAAQAHLAALTADAERLRDLKDSYADRLARTETRLEEKEKTIRELRDELKRVADELVAQSEQTKSAAVELEREASAAATLRGALAAAEARGEAATREATTLRGELAVAETRGEMATRELTALRDELATLEARCAAAETEKTRALVDLAAAVEAREAATREVSAAVEAREAATREAAAAVEACEVATREAVAAMKAREVSTREATDAVKAYEATERRCDALDIQCQEAQSTIDTLKRELKSLVEKNEELLKALDEKDQKVRTLEELNSEAKRESEARAKEAARLAEELRRATCERDEARLAGERAAAAERRDREERSAAAAAADRELADRAGTIARLMQDVTAEVEARARADAALRAARADLGAARDERARSDEHARRLDAALRAAQKDGADQMKIILDIRGEKEKLQEKIRDMQSKIDNIQQLTREQPAAAALHREPPEHDDNAVTTPPKPHGECGVNESRAPTPSPVQRSFPKGVFATPNPPAVDAHIFNFLSDSMSSMEDNAIDPVEVNRRFEALSRGVPLPRVPLSALKRRRNVDRVCRSYPASTQVGAAQSAVATQSATEAQKLAAAAAQESKVKFFKTRRPDPRTKKQK